MVNFNHEIGEFLSYFKNFLKDENLIQEVEGEIDSFDNEENGMECNGFYGFGF